jgi:hypothetical protein
MKLRSSPIEGKKILKRLMSLKQKKKNKTKQEEAKSSR